MLFHKNELQSRDETSLSEQVVKAIESKKQRVVGAVINAVDDFLMKGEQLDIRWDKDGIKVLPQLLYEAKSAGRMVVLLSDHGHILDRETKQDTFEGGERWRHIADPNEGEIVISGDRCVIPETHQLIVPWSEKIRYSMKKNGYHGGVTMQEMLVPMAVLSAREDLPEGWIEPNSDVPSWWFEPMTRTPYIEPTDDADDAIEVATPTGFLFDKHVMNTSQGNSASSAKAEPGGGSSESDSVTADSASVAGYDSPGWVESLLESSIYQSQKSMAGRKPPEDEVVRKLVAALDAHGGKLTTTALGLKLGVPAFRLPGTLAVIQRVLNVEGYSILIRDEASDSVELNCDLMLTQFELNEGEPS